MIPYGRQDVRQQDIDAVVEVLRSDFLTQGPAVPRFEAALARHVGAAHAVAVNSATSALHVACLALGVGPGDWVWTSPITFVASANCALYCGARVDFVDVDPRTCNLCPAALAAKLAQAETDGRLPKLLIAVHLGGQSCDMRAIRRLAERYGVKLVEDASHAVGAKYLDGYVGDCRYSDAVVFSFHPVKIITSAEGGMIVTNDAGLAERAALFRSHGITRDPALMEGEADGPWSYQQIALGFNYRMTDLQAALGISQLARLDAYVAARHRLVARYDALLADCPAQRPWQHPDGYSAFHLYPIRVPADRRRTVFERMRASGIGVNVHYIPVHLQPYYRRLGFGPGDFPEAERYYAEAITLPLYATLSEDEVARVVAALRDALAA